MKSEKGETIFEISITFLPIALLFVIFAVFANWRRVLEHEEWLFVSAVLQAQAFGKLFIASDHPGIRNKPLLYTVAIFLVIGIVACSMIIAKNFILQTPDRVLMVRRTYPTNLTESARATSDHPPTPPLQVIEERFEVEDNEETVKNKTNILQNCFAVVAAGAVFAWAAGVESASRSPQSRV